jgi:hypothetical protein
MGGCIIGALRPMKLSRDHFFLLGVLCLNDIDTSTAVCILVMQRLCAILKTFE